MPVRSRYADPAIPAVSLTVFVFGLPEGDENRAAFVCAATGHSLSVAELRTQVRRLAARSCDACWWNTSGPPPGRHRPGSWVPARPRHHC
jgi:hypothetical protein